MSEKWTEGISLYVNAGPEDGIDYYDIWHNGGPGGPMLVAFHENSARAICSAIEELHELRAEVADLQMLRDEHMIDTEHAHAEGITQGAAAEREAIVRYLTEGGYVCAACRDVAVSELVVGIERGEHRRKRGPAEDDSIEFRDISKED